MTITRPDPEPSGRAFWVFFGGYAVICTLWLTWSMATLVDPHLLAGLKDVHMQSDVSQHGQDLVLSLSTLGLGLSLAWLAPDSRTARWFAVGLVGTAVGFSLTAHHLLEMVDPASMRSLSFAPVPLLHVAFHLIAGGAYVYALLLFPNNRLPKPSRDTMFVWLLLLLTFVILIARGHEPAYFILFCGIAVVLAGWYSQFHKANSPDDGEGEQALADRARSRDFERSFRLALMIAVGLIALEWVFPWHSILGIDSPGAGLMPRAASIVLTAVPPLLAGTAVVVFVGILQHELWDVRIAHKRQLATILFVGVMALFVVAEIVVHGLVSEIDGHMEMTVGVSVVVAITATVLIEHSRETLKEKCNELVFGTPVDPRKFDVELADELKTSVSPEAVVPALAAVLHRCLDVTAGKIDIKPLPAESGVHEWPPGADVREAAFPLDDEDRDLGTIQVSLGSGRPITAPQRRLVQELGATAARELLERVETVDTWPPLEVTDEVVLRVRVPRQTPRRSEEQIDEQPGL